MRSDQWRSAYEKKSIEHRPDPGPVPGYAARNSVGGAGPGPRPASQEVTSQATPAEQDVTLEEQDTEKQDAEEQDIEEQDGEEQVPETTPPTYSGGSGTERNPWLISTADD